MLSSFVADVCFCRVGWDLSTTPNENFVFSLELNGVFVVGVGGATKNENGFENKASK